MKKGTIIMIDINDDIVDALNKKFEKSYSDDGISFYNTNDGNRNNIFSISSKSSDGTYVFTSWGVTSDELKEDKKFPMQYWLDEEMNVTLGLTLTSSRKLYDWYNGGNILPITNGGLFHYLVDYKGFEWSDRRIVKDMSGNWRIEEEVSDSGFWNTLPRKDKNLISLFNSLIIKEEENENV